MHPLYSVGSFRKCADEGQAQVVDLMAALRDSVEAAKEKAKARADDASDDEAASG